MIRIEEVHENGAVVVYAELPGIEPDRDIEVTASEGVLHISATGQGRTEQKDKEEATYHSELGYGHFTREMVLPDGVDGPAVRATYRDGILEVRVPWHNQPKAATIKVPVNRT